MWVVTDAYAGARGPAPILLLLPKMTKVPQIPMVHHVPKVTTYWFYIAADCSISRQTLRKNPRRFLDPRARKGIYHLYSSYIGADVLRRKGAGGAVCIRCVSICRAVSYWACPQNWLVMPCMFFTQSINQSISCLSANVTAWPKGAG